MESWNRQKLQTERNRFIAARKDHVSWTGLTAIFFVTLVAAWLTGAGLHRFTSLSLPWRSVAAIALGYGTFFLAVRVWADFQKSPPEYRPKGDDLGMYDAMVVPDGQGYVFALILLLPFALLLGGLLSWFGTAMLLEVAFELAFSGMVIRNAWRAETSVGNWAGVLLRKTGWIAVILMISVFACASFIQSRYLSVQTAADVLRLLLR